MKNAHLYIITIPIRNVLRIGFLMLMSVYISAGHLSQCLDFFEASGIELMEEKDTETEEKESKEVSESGKFFGSLFTYSFSKKAVTLEHHIAVANWNDNHGDTPTPPPKHHFA